MLCQLKAGSTSSLPATVKAAMRSCRLAPGTRTPCSHHVDVKTQAIILRLREGLVAASLDAGARTLAHHLVPLVDRVPSVATIRRILYPLSL